MSSYLPRKSGQGSLAQVLSHQGGSKMQFALSCLGQHSPYHDPPSPSSWKGKVSTGDDHASTHHVGTPHRPQPQPKTAYAIWVADGGFLYPPTVYHHWTIPLERLLLVRVKDPMDVWRVGLEAVQTGLFLWVLLRPSQNCPVSYLRKIQLATEKNQSQVLTLCQTKLPHWIVRGVGSKDTEQRNGSDKTDTFFTNLGGTSRTFSREFQRSLSGSHPQNSHFLQ